MNHLPTMGELVVLLDKTFVALGVELDNIGRVLIELANGISFNKYQLVSFTEVIDTLLEIIKLQLYHSIGNSVLIIILFVIILSKRTNKNG